MQYIDLCINESPGEKSFLASLLPRPSCGSCGTVAWMVRPPPPVDPAHQAMLDTASVRCRPRGCPAVPLRPRRAPRAGRDDPAGPLPFNVSELPGEVRNNALQRWIQRAARAVRSIGVAHQPHCLPIRAPAAPPTQIPPPGSLAPRAEQMPPPGASASPPPPWGPRGEEAGGVIPPGPLLRLLSPRTLLTRRPPHPSSMGGGTRP